MNITKVVLSYCALGTITTVTLHITSRFPHCVPVNPSLLSLPQGEGRFKSPLPRRVHPERFTVNGRGKGEGDTLLLASTR